MKEKLAKLIDVKSIVTLLLTVVFCVLCIIGALPTAFLSIYTMIIGFYFGTQAQKQAEAKKLPVQEPVAQLPILGDTEPTYDPVDAATDNDVRPPDEATAKVGFEY